MPRPAILPVLDWKNILEQGQDFPTWIAATESEEQADRMNEALARQEIDPGQVARLSLLKRKVHVLAFAEDWCGDVVRHVPVLEKLARIHEPLDVRYCTRADQPELFARFLTNGGEAVPKFVFLCENFVECANWGPMPDSLREIISRGKACGNVKSAREITSRLYREDSSCSAVVAELIDRLVIASAECP